MSKFTSPPPDTAAPVAEALRRLTGDYAGFDIQNSVAARINRLQGTPAENSAEMTELRAMVADGSDWDSLVNTPGNNRRLWIVMRLIGERLNGEA